MADSPQEGSAPGSSAAGSSAAGSTARKSRRRRRGKRWRGQKGTPADPSTGDGDKLRPQDSNNAAIAPVELVGNLMHEIDDMLDTDAATADLAAGGGGPKRARQQQQQDADDADAALQDAEESSGSDEQEDDFGGAAKRRMLRVLCGSREWSLPADVASRASGFFRFAAV
eukprot:1749605-Prymnesium_polylepis.1